MTKESNSNLEKWILINGEVYVINYPINLKQFFTFLGNTNTGLITEYNQVILNPNLSKNIFLTHLDRIEFITIVGGG